MLLILLALCLRKTNVISHLFSITYAFAGNGCIYASLKVPEVWRHNGATLQFFHLVGERYTQTSESGLFPLLAAEVLTGFVQQGREQGTIPMIRAFRDWVRAHRQQ
jgi:hypothetical protein